MAAKTVSEVVRIEELRAYLELHGLRVVRGGWRFGAQRPWVITGPALPAETISEEEKGETDGSKDD
jgi:hypothetical protein